MTQQSTVPAQTMEQLACAAEDAALEAVRLTLAAYSTRSQSISAEAVRALEEARGYADRVTEQDGDLHLMEAEQAAHSASLLALEAHVLAMLHKRLTARLDAGEGLHLFDRDDEELAELFEERDTLPALWEMMGDY